MNDNSANVVDDRTGERWAYSPIVKDHFFNPRNFLISESPEKNFDASGRVGSPACGDIMEMWIKVDRAGDRITDLEWRTFGCASAIASTSMFSVMVTESGGMKIDDALKIKPQDILARLGGLPDRKIHCSVLADKAFREAINAYFRATGQHERIISEGARIVDQRLRISDRDIEEAVLDGAQTLEDVQKKLKVGAGDPAALPEIEQLIRFYREKYDYKK